MSIINMQSLAKVGYASLIIVGYNKGVGPLTKMMDDAAGKYLPESWIKWIPTSYIAKAVLIGGAAFGMHNLQTGSQSPKVVEKGGVNLENSTVSLVRSATCSNLLDQDGLNALGKDVVTFAKAIQTIVEGGQLQQLNAAITKAGGGKFAQFDQVAEKVVALGLSFANADAPDEALI